MNKPTQQTSQESLKTVGIGFLIIIATGIVIGGIMHFSSDPASSQPAVAVGVNHESSNLAADGQSKPVSSKAPTASRIHSVSPYAAKVDREATTASATLDKRYSIGERQQLFDKFTQQQDAVRVEIHSKYEQLPLAASPEENAQRSGEEGQKILDAQADAYDACQKDYRLTDDQMGDLVQEGRDNHWDQNTAVSQ